MGAIMYAGSDLNNSPYAQFLGTPPPGQWMEASSPPGGVFRGGGEGKGEFEEKGGKKGEKWW